MVRLKKAHMHIGIIQYFWKKNVRIYSRHILPLAVQILSSPLQFYRNSTYLIWSTIFSTKQTQKSHQNHLSDILNIWRCVYEMHKNTVVNNSKWHWLMLDRLQRVFKVPAVCINYSFLSQTELTQSLNSHLIDHRYLAHHYYQQNNNNLFAK